MARKLSARNASQFSAFNLLTAWEQPVCGDVTTPFVDSQTIYVACEHKYVFAFDPNAAGDSQVRWRYELSDMRITAMESLEGGLLIGSDHNLYAFDGLSGQVRWQYKLRAGGPKSGKFLTPSVAQLKQVPPYIHFLNHSGLFTLDSRTGQERAFISSWREWNHLIADPSLIYVTEKYDGIVEALAPETSWPTWHFECDASIKVAPMVDDSSLFCASHDGYLHVLEKRTGQLKGSIQLGTRAAATPVTDGGNVLFVVTDEASVLALDVRRARAASSSGEAFRLSREDWLWTFETQKGRLQSPLLFDAALFVTTDDGVIYGLDAQTGQLIWQHDLDTQGRLELCRSGDTLIAATSGRLVGFRAPPGFGSQPRPAQWSQPGPAHQPALPPSAGEVLLSPVMVVPPLDLMLPDLNLPQEVWSITLPAQVATGIVAASSRVVVGCAEQTLVSVCAEDASILWQTKVECDLHGAWQVSPDRVCVADKENLYCLDAATGSRRWRHQTGGPAQCGAVMGDDVVFYTLDDGRLVCLNKVTGEALWERLGEEGSHPCLPCSDGILLFTGDKQGVRTLLLESGWESWFTPTVGQVASSLFHLEGRVFAGCADRRLYAFDARSGELLWVFKTKDQVCYPPAALADGSLVVASQDQFVYALNPADGTLRWRYALGSVPCGEPTVAVDTVFVGTSDGVICALEAESGRLRWKHELGGEGLKAGPTVSGSYLYAATDARRLICLRPQPRA